MSLYNEIKSAEKKLSLLKEKDQLISDMAIFATEAREMREKPRKTSYGIKELHLSSYTQCSGDLKITSIEWADYPPEFFDILTEICEQQINKIDLKLESLK